MNADRKGDGVDRGAERARWVEEYRASGLGLKRFAAEHGLKTGQLHYWVYDGRKPRVAEAAAPTFREVMLGGVAEGRTAWNAEIVLPDGTIVRFDRGADVARVSAVLGALRRPCSP